MEQVLGGFLFGHPPASGGGTTITQLPVWTYTAGAMAAGKFKTDNSTPTSVSSISFSDASKTGDQTWEGFFNNSISVGCLIGLTNSSGVPYFYRVTGIVDNTGFTTLSVAQVSAASTAFSGDFYVTFALAHLIFDTGWTANSDVGSKTAVIPDDATLNAMVAALNLVASGFGDAFVAVADKVKAIESTLATGILPNA